jgi:hypothetical protein
LFSAYFLHLEHDKFATCSGWDLVLLFDHYFNVSVQMNALPPH